jgi:2-polyprenyl-3-methyl-5-hydroxy-6-metoxy-1,4-benzoquinol methylase
MTPRVAMKKATDWVASHAWPLRHFERIYAHAVDPWNCETSEYEVLKLRATTDAVVRLSPAGPVFDVGCGEGRLAEALAVAGFSVSATDISPSAISRARQRCASYSNVRIFEGNVLTCAIPDRFGIIVLSEVLYYLGLGPRRRAMCRRLIECLAERGHLVVTNPWPSSRAIERSLRTDARLEFIDEQVHRDPGRSYAISTYRLR